MGTLSVDKLMKTSTGAAEFTLPAADGTAGQSMITDGAGQLSLGNPTVSGIAVAATTLTASSTLAVTGTATLSGATTVAGAFTSLGIDDNATANSITIDSTGAVTKPLTPAFFAYNAVADLNVTGNGVQYTVLFDTETYDQNADFNPATGTFTAPVSGRYFLQAAVSTDAQTTTNTDGDIQLTTSNKALAVYYSPGYMEGRAVSGQCTIGIQGVMDMDANDTATIKIRIYQGSQNIGITANNSWFSGVLVA